MEESGDIMLNSLANSGVSIPPGVASASDLTPTTLYAVSSFALCLIENHTSSLPASLPEDSGFMFERVKACTDLALAFINTGFNGDLSFHQFLYLSEDDLYKLVRFLVGKLSETSGAQAAALTDGEDKTRVNLGNVHDETEEPVQKLEDLGLRTPVPESSNMKSTDHIARKSDELSSGIPIVDITAEENYMAIIQNCGESQLDEGDEGKYSRETESLENNAFRDQNFPRDVISQNQEEIPKKQVNSNLDVHVEEEFHLLKAAAEMVFDGQQPIEYQMERLNDQVEVKNQKLKELESEWDFIEKTLQDKKINLMQSLSEFHPEVHAKLAKRDEIELGIEFVSAEIKRREEEISKLSSDLEKQTKLPPRRSYIERINEITKNSRKQDNDIQRILKDTRELQLESNTIQERLNRTYAVIDETIFREGKKDPVARQAYKLLTNIHQSFEQIAEKILATDRCRRDTADYEDKLATISARRVNVDKLQEDLYPLIKENDPLEERVHN